MTTSLLLHHSILEIPMESDGQLIARIERQDKEALEKLYDRHADKSMGLALQILQDHALAEQVTIEAFWQVWRFAFQFRSAQASFSDWFYGIVYQLCLDILQRQAGSPLADSVEPPSKIGGRPPTRTPKTSALKFHQPQRNPR